MSPDILLSVGAARVHSPEELAALGLLSFARARAGPKTREEESQER